MTTPVVKTVGPGKDYETLQEWWDAIRTAGHAAQWAECYGGADLGQLYVGNNTFTPNATDYVRVYAAPGQRHNGISATSGAYVNYAGPPDRTYGVTNYTLSNDKTDYMRIEGLAFNSQSDGDHDHWAIGLDSCQNVLVDGCLMVGVGSGVNPVGDNGCVVLATGRNASVTVRNCIARNYVNTGSAASPPGGHGFIAVDNSGGSFNVAVTYQNCTAYNCYYPFGTYAPIA